MNTLHRTARRGFTLVEILIVVIILGILAAIVIPQFTNASQDARRNSLTSQLQTIRSQLELYKMQHLDQPPTLLFVDNSTDWSQMLQKTNKFGTLQTDGDFGPYLQQLPNNPLNGLSKVKCLAIGTADPDFTSGPPASGVTDCGYVINLSNGKIWATSAKGAYIFSETDLSNSFNDQ